MRLATNAGSKNSNIVISSPLAHRQTPLYLFRRAFESVRGVEGLLKLCDVVVEQLEVIGDLLFAADGGRQDDNLPARLTCDAVRRFEIEVRLNGNDLDAVALHLLNQREIMLRTRGNAGARFDIADDIQAEMVSEIRPRAMVGDDLAPGVGLHLRQPLLIGLLEPLFERGVPLRKIGGVIRMHLAEFVLNALCDAQTVFRIEPVVRIAKRVDIAFGTRHLSRWNLENPGETRGI